jgi:hypothetical protein
MEAVPEMLIVYLNLFSKLVLFGIRCRVSEWKVPEVSDRNFMNVHSFHSFRLDGTGLRYSNTCVRGAGAPNTRKRLEQIQLINCGKKAKGAQQH